MYTPQSPLTSATDSRQVPKETSELSDAEKRALNSNNKALNAIFTSVGKTAFYAWTTLCRTYEGDDKVKKLKLQMIINTYNVLTMKESKTFDPFYLKLTDLLNELMALSIQILRL